MAHVIGILFNYVPIKIGEEEYAILVRQLIGSEFIEDMPEFDPWFSPLVSMPFGCYSMMFWSHDCSKVHDGG